MRDRDLTTFVVLRPRLRAAVPGHRRQQGAGRPRPALACRRRPTAAPGADPGPETIGKAKACYAGGAVQIYLNLAGRDPALPGAAGRWAPRLEQIPAPAEESEATVVARIKAAFRALKDPNDWTGDGQPEDWKVIDRVYTKAEARYIPNGAGSDGRHGAPDPHGRRGRLLLPAVPVRRRDARHADRAARRSSASTATCRTCRTCRSNTNMRATFLAGGDADRARRGATTCASIDLAPTAAFLLGIPAPQHSQGVVRRDIIDDGDDYTPVSIIGLNDFHGQLDAGARPRSTRTRPCPSAAPRSSRRCSTRRPPRCPGQTLLLAAGDNVGASPPNSALLEDMPAIDVENAWGLDATSFGNHEFDFGVERILQAPGAGELPVPVDQHRRDGDRPRAGVDADVRGLPRQRRAGRRDRLDRAQHARARQARQHRGPRVPRRGRADPARVGEAARAGRERAGRRHPRGRRRPAPTRSAAAGDAVGRARSSGSSTSCRTRPSTS